MAACLAGAARAQDTVVIGSGQPEVEVNEQALYGLGPAHGGGSGGGGAGLGPDGLPIYDPAMGPPHSQVLVPGASRMAPSARTAPVGEAPIRLRPPSRAAAAAAKPPPAPMREQAAAPPPQPKAPPAKAAMPAAPKPAAQAAAPSPPPPPPVPAPRTAAAEPPKPMAPAAPARTEPEPSAAKAPAMAAKEPEMTAPKAPAAEMAAKEPGKAAAPAPKPSSPPAPSAAPAPPPAPAQKTASKPEPMPAPKPEAKPEPAPESVAALPSAEPPASAGVGVAGETFTVAFAPGGAELPEEARPGLDRLVAQLSGDAAMRLQLKAYAAAEDASASAARRLSLTRALSVRSYLIDAGVNSTRIDVRALGSKYESGPPDRVDVITVR